MSFKLKISFVILALMGFLVPSIAYAEDGPSYFLNRGFNLSPGLIEDWFNAGESKDKYVYITNNTGKRTTFIFEVEDFEAAPKPSDPIRLLGEQSGIYSLKEYISAEAKEITLDNGQTEKVKVTISIPEDSPSGGMYGSFLVKTKPEPSNTQSGAQVISRLGTLFFIGVKGTVYKSAHLLDFKTGDYCKKTKKTDCVGERFFSFTIVNNGNTHVAPVAKIEIKNILGRKIDEETSKDWYVLPRSSREREVVWKQKGPMFGIYRADLTVNMGYDGYTESGRVYFTYFPWKMAFLAFAFALVFMALFIWTKEHFRFVLKIIPKGVKNKKNKGSKETCEPQE